MAIYSYLAATATPAEYYTTVSENEVITFAIGAQAVTLNSLLIENCGDATMYVEVSGSGYLLCIPASDAREITAYKAGEFVANKIKVLGAAGQKIRYSGTVV